MKLHRGRFRSRKTMKKALGLGKHGHTLKEPKEERKAAPGLLQRINPFALAAAMSGRKSQRDKK